MRRTKYEIKHKSKQSEFYIHLHFCIFFINYFILLCLTTEETLQTLNNECPYVSSIYLHYNCPVILMNNSTTKQDNILFHTTPRSTACINYSDFCGIYSVALIYMYKRNNSHSYLCPHYNYSFKFIKSA